MPSYIIENASQVLTMSGTGWEPLKGQKMRRLRIKENSAIIIDDRRIIGVFDQDKSHSLKEKYGAETIDARGHVVMPGLVDSHTHIVYGGTREEEFYMKIKGKTYLEILNSGNGIYRTVEQTRNSSEDQIFSQSLSRVYDAISSGTTTMEIKTGYGLDIETELRMLSVISRLSGLGIINVIPTFLPLHAIPKGSREDEYLNYVVDRMLPRFKGKTAYADAFCDLGAFSPGATETFLRAAMESGMKLRMHADELGDIGCLSILDRLKVDSVDHLLCTGEDGMDHIGKSGTMATFLPITAFNIADGKYPDIGKFISKGIPVSIATDSSPVSYNSNLFFALYLAVRYCNISIEEALNAITINPAHSLGIHEVSGSIEPGKRADIIILNVDDYRKIPYEYGSRLVDTVITAGEPVMRNGIMQL